MALFGGKSIAASDVVKESTGSAESKEAARKCLHDADRFIKEHRFDEARREVQKARKLDPSNQYTIAFLDRIDYFEQETLKARKAQRGTTTPAGSSQSPVSPQPHEATLAPDHEHGSSPVDDHAASLHTSFDHRSSDSAAESARVTPSSGKAYGDAVHPQEEQPERYNAPPPDIPRRVAAAEESAPSIARRRAGAFPTADRSPVHAPTGTKPELEHELEQMKRQIEELTRSLQQERQAREELKSQQLQASVAQFRAEVVRAWENGAPNEQEAERLRRMAQSLAIPEASERSVVREVKLEMYGRAVKEVIAKRKLLRSSSSTLEWLRKVYQVTVEEYLEYESKFLMDLVAEQYKGTLLLVSDDPFTTKELAGGLKASGYAVVMAATPEVALEKIERVNPHFIVVESQFGQSTLSGVKLLHILRVNSKYSALPYILLCDAKDVGELQSSELRPNEGFLRKPPDLDALSALMHEKSLKYREYISSLS